MEILSINRIHLLSFRFEGNVIFGPSVVKNSAQVMHFFFVVNLHVSWYIVQEGCFSQYCNLPVARSDSVILRTILQSADVGCREEFL